MADIRRPNITATTVDGQLTQMKNYMYQLTNQLNFALKAAEDEEKKALQYSSIKSGGAGGNSTNASGGNSINSEVEDAQKTFNEIKDLIIKSADIVNAYYEEINRRLSSEYVATSVYGEYVEKNDKFVSETSTNLTEYYESVKEVKSDIENLSEMRKDSFYIRTGWLDDGKTIGGVELGQVSEDSTGVDTAFARFTTKKLAFYGQDGETELGSFEQYRMKIKEAEISGDAYIRDYKLDTDNGIAFKWVGDS